MQDNARMKIIDTKALQILYSSQIIKQLYTPSSPADFNDSSVYELLYAHEMNIARAVL